MKLAIPLLFAGVLSFSQAPQELVAKARICKLEERDELRKQILALDENSNTVVLDALMNGPKVSEDVLSAIVADLSAESFAKRQEAVDRLVNLYPLARQFLKSRSESQDLFVRMQLKIVVALGEREQDNDFDRYLWFAQTLCEYGKEKFTAESVKSLFKFVGSSNLSAPPGIAREMLLCCCYAANQPPELPAPEDVPALIEIASSLDNSEQSFVYSWMSKRKEPWAEKFLVSALIRESNLYSRRHLYRILLSKKNKWAMEYYESDLRSSVPYTRFNAYLIAVDFIPSLSAAEAFDNESCEKILKAVKEKLGY